MTRNPLSYPGNKNKLVRQIIPELFVTDRLVDVFCGGGVIGLNSHSTEVCLNDISIWATRILEKLYLVNFLDLVAEIENRITKYQLTYSRNHPKTFYKEHNHEGLSRYNKQGYEKLKEHFNQSQDLFDLITLQIYGFNHYIRFNKKGEFNVPVGKVDFSASIYRDLENFLELIKSKNIEFSNRDFRDISLYSDKKAMYYFDPPYLITTAPYNESWNEKLERDLLSLLDNLNKKKMKFALSNVFLSNGKTNDILIKWAKKYNVLTLQRQYRNANYQKRNITDSIEVLIKNY